jgi:hypothetical protein
VCRQPSTGNARRGVTWFTGASYLPHLRQMLAAARPVDTPSCRDTGAADHGVQLISPMNSGFEVAQ